MDIFRIRVGGSSDANVRAFWLKKFRFLKFMVCPNKEIEPVRTRRGCQIFDLGRHLLWTGLRIIEAQKSFIS